VSSGREEPPERRFWEALVRSFDQFEQDSPEGMTTVAEVKTITGDTFTASVVLHDHRAQWLRMALFADLSDEKLSGIVAIPNHAIASIEIRYRRATPKVRPGFTIAGDEGESEAES
jgi:hypothetical protein